MIESTKKFGKYRLLERLAVGGMAEIYKASAGGLDGFEKIVAIKRLHRQFSEDSEFATMLIDEARIVVQLSHANIGQVFDLGCIGGQYFIVMEYIQGLDLHELATRVRRQHRRLPLEAVVYVSARVAEALHYAHTRKGPDGKSMDIVHRDVSPQNIMLSVDGEVKLVDFGIAKARSRVQNTQAGIIKGKFYYMSPEQALGERIDARTDVYALGMVLYEILSGEHPFDRVPDGDLLRSVRKADFAPIGDVVSDLPRGLSRVIDRALAREKNRRYGSAMELQRELERFAGKELPWFSRMELSELVQKYEQGDLPETTRAAGSLDAMARKDFTASQESVIFTIDEEALGDFSDDEATQIFMRDREEHFEDLEADGETALLDWGSSEDGEGRKEDSELRIPEDLRRTVEGRAQDRGSFESGEAQKKEGGAIWSGGGTKIHQRLATTMMTRFDRLLRKRPHLVGGALAAAAVLVMAVAALVFFGIPGQAERKGPEDWHASIGAEREAEEEGARVLAVSTTPGNADLYVDGRHAGRTPTTVGELEIGEAVVLRFEREGYNVKELSFIVEPDAAPLVVRLEPLGGILRVNSQPEGVEIFLDGESQGETPVTVLGLERDLRYEIEARSPGGAVESREVRWESGEERMKEVEFLFADELEARREKSGREEGPRRGARRRAPRQARAESSAPSRIETRSEVGSTASLDIWEVAERAETGRLNVRVNGEEGRIFVNGELVQEGRVLVGHQLDAGTHEVRVYFPTLKRHSEMHSVQVRVGETSTLTISP